MQRTYRSKKDSAGGLDHRDILNFDDRNSVFEAFYIQNLKQTKRAKFCPSSNKYVAASKIRKQKYSKRIIKEVEPICKDTLSLSVCLTPDKSIRVNKAFDLFDGLRNSSTCLTPDKSIRVNKALDPFDVLLNSPLPTQVKKDCNKCILNNKPSKRIYYTCKKKQRWNKIKIINSSNSETDSDKENIVVSHNKTDIRKYELMVEKDSISANNNVADESISKIIQNFAGLYSLKNNNTDNFIRLSRNNEGDNIDLPNLPRSPLCSTPFKEKYHSKSIYKFSPIFHDYSDSAHESTMSEKVTNSPNNVVPIEKNVELELCKSPILHICNSSLNDREDSQCIKIDEIQDSKINSDYTQNEQSSVLNRSILNIFTTDTSLHYSETKPFFGFSEKNDDSVSADDKEIVQNDSCLNLDQVSSQEISIVTEDFVTGKGNDGTVVLDTGENVIKSNNSKYEDGTELSTSNTAVNENELDCINSERETMYDTCNTESLEDISATVCCEPRVLLERMNDSIFFKYYDKMLLTSEDNNSEICSLDNNSNSQSFQEVNLDSDELNSFISDNEISSIIEDKELFYSERDDDPVSFSDEFSTSISNGEGISFVTTRRKKYFNSIDFQNRELYNIEETIDSSKDEDNETNENIDQDPTVSYDNEEKSNLNVSIMTGRTLDRNTIEAKPCIVLQPGKKWERSLSIFRRMTMMNANLNHSILDESLQMKGRKYRQSVINTIEMQEFSGPLHNDSINNRRSTFVSKPSRTTIKILKEPNITRVSSYSTAAYDDLQGNKCFINDYDDVLRDKKWIKHIMLL